MAFSFKYIVTYRLHLCSPHPCSLFKEEVGSFVLERFQSGFFCLQPCVAI